MTNLHLPPAHTGNIHKLGRLVAHEWWTVTDKEAKTKERYVFLFKSRLLVCKVRRISDDRSVFVLRDIVRLPDAQIVDQPNGSATIERSGFEVRPTDAAGAVFTFSSHQDEARIKWLREIGHYASDPLALHEHAVDDLRIDPSQIKADTDADAFRLPPRIDAHEPDLVRPSEVAQDYLPTETKHKQQQQQQQQVVVETIVVEQQQAEQKSSTQSTEVVQQTIATATTTSTSISSTKSESQTAAQISSSQVIAEKTIEEVKVETKNQINLSQSAAVSVSVKSVEEAKVEAKNKINLSQSLAAAKSTDAKPETTQQQIAEQSVSVTKVDTSASKTAEVAVTAKIVKESTPRSAKAAEEVAHPYTVTEPRTPNASSAALNTVPAETITKPSSAVQGIHICIFVLGVF